MGKTSNMNIPKILIIPARRHIIESYCEYLIRYLSDEFYFEMGYPPDSVYYSTIKNHVWNNLTSPLDKNPDDFDLIYPHFDSHWFLEPEEKYRHKIASVILEPGAPRYKVAVAAGTSPIVMEGMPKGSHDLRFGVDTELFKPLLFNRSDDLLHVGFVGNIQTPRRYLKELFVQLYGMPGIKLDIYPTSWLKHTRSDEIEAMGGQIALDNIVDGDKWLSGLPNIYNKMDVFVRVDINHGYQFSVMEAAACGTPVICTDSGNTKELCEAGGGILIETKQGDWSDDNLRETAQRIRDAVKSMRDDLLRTQMGHNARRFVVENYQWDKHIPSWRTFFREGVKNARKKV